MNRPDCEGWWLFKGWGDEPLEVEVYLGPNDCSLCVWCEDVGAAHYEQSLSHGDEMCGHIIVTDGDGEWTYLRPLD